jgi:xanthine dehydrogenase YagS FAD-binding subunit
MTPFAYKRARNAAEAIGMHDGEASRFIGGGTNLVDLMREAIERPTTLVDVRALSQNIREEADGNLVIGAATSNTAVAAHHLVRARYPLLARAILSGASGQIRNMATVGGNLMQRTRCAYFYDDDAARCNKRAPGQGCDARDGFNRNHAILGASDACIAVHPSDMCVALAALDATVRVQGPNGAREIPFAQFHRLPEQDPERDTTLGPRELITEIVLPALPVASRSTYRKVRDRASYAFALVSVAAALTVRDGKVADVRIALGGVAHKPWRASKAEAALYAQPASEDRFLAAADAELAMAVAQRDNAFKVELARRLIASTLRALAGDQT